MKTSSKPVGEKELQGFAYLKHFRHLFAGLHNHAVDKAGNRKLYYDQYASLLLLYFFTPTLTSLRGLAQATELNKVQKRLGISRHGRTTLSEAARAFDPQLLKPIIAQLAQHAQTVVDPLTAQALQGLTAVDGTLLPALPKMAWALWMDATHHAAKAHVHFEVLKAVPVDATLTPGASSEIEQMRLHLQSDRLYVCDRGYLSYALFRAILDAGSSFVIRVKNNTAYQLQEERSLSQEAHAAGVVRDLVAKRLGTSHHKDEICHPLRLVHVRTGKTDEHGEDEVLILCTDRLDLSADLVALAYRYRWWVELFFRWLKCILGMRHLISHSWPGVTIQFYLALIASLIVSVWTQSKPNKRTFEMLCFYFSGWATEEELQAHIEKIQQQQKNDSS